MIFCFSLYTTQLIFVAFFTSSSSSNQYALIRCFCFFWCSSSKYLCRRVCVVFWGVQICVSVCVRVPIAVFFLILILPTPSSGRCQRGRWVTPSPVSSVPNSGFFFLIWPRFRLRYFLTFPSKNSTFFSTFAFVSLSLALCVCVFLLLSSVRLRGVLLCVRLAVICLVPVLFVLLLCMYVCML